MLYLCMRAQLFLQEMFKTEENSRGNERDSYIPQFQWFSPLTPPLKNKETLSLERRNPYSTGWCCCRCIFPLYPSHVFPPIRSPAFFCAHFFLICRGIYYELTLLTLGSFRMEGSLGGGSGSRLRRVCVCVCLCKRVQKRVCDPPATLAQRALCAPLRFITPPLFSTAFSFYAIPFLCSRCQSCSLTLSCTHI